MDKCGPVESAMYQSRPITAGLDSGEATLSKQGSCSAERCGRYCRFRRVSGMRFVLPVASSPLQHIDGASQWDLARAGPQQAVPRWLLRSSDVGVSRHWWPCFAQAGACCLVYLECEEITAGRETAASVRQSLQTGKRFDRIGRTAPRWETSAAAATPACQ
jgi:hypothetical protein